MLIYIYSMQSFVFGAMNRSSREKDETKIDFYGPLASALSYIIHCGNRQNTDLSENFKVYRGLKVSTEELANNYKIGSKIHLQGYTSSSFDRKTAAGFCFYGADGVEKHPLLFEIQVQGAEGYIYLNSNELSAYPEEKELLL